MSISTLATYWYTPSQRFLAPEELIPMTTKQGLCISSRAAGVHDRRHGVGMSVTDYSTEDAEAADRWPSRPTYPSCQLPRTHSVNSRLPWDVGSSEKEETGRHLRVFNIFAEVHVLLRYLLHFRHPSINPSSPPRNGGYVILAVIMLHNSTTDQPDPC